MKNKPISIKNVLLLLLLTISFQCSSTKRAHKLPVEQETTLRYTTPYFQAWVVPITIGTDGVHIYIPNLETKKGVTIEDVFFRNMIGKLKKGRALYQATLTRAAPDDRAQAAKVFPFDLLKNECVISYVENGITKYYLINKLMERQGVYYKDGLPKDKM